MARINSLLMEKAFTLLTIEYIIAREHYPATGAIPQ